MLGQGTSTGKATKYNRFISHDAVGVSNTVLRIG